MKRPNLTLSIASLLSCGALVFGTIASAFALAPLEDKTHRYTIFLVEHPCAGNGASPTAPTTGACGFETSVQSHALDNGELSWERLLYSETYADAATAQKQRATVTAFKFNGSKKQTLLIENKKKDRFEVEIKSGHLKKPKTPKTY
ncbi:MAG: hypothetical protein RBT63_10010 [Bdellovibrionales bacterium]|jgi:hypothetical protein|nr:hypothetical protein [Bdellovibrionales bacterium]